MTYPYKNLPMATPIFRHLLFEVVPLHENLHRSVVIKMVNDRHGELGGDTSLPEAKQLLIHKNVYAQLAEKNCAKFIMKGYWCLTARPDEIAKVTIGLELDEDVAKWVTVCSQKTINSLLRNLMEKRN